MTMITTAFITTSILAFTAGFMVGLFYTTKAMAEGKVKNVTLKYNDNI